MLWLISALLALLIIISSLQLKWLLHDVHMIRAVHEQMLESMRNGFKAANETLYLIQTQDRKPL